MKAIGSLFGILLFFFLLLITEGRQPDAVPQFVGEVQNAQDDAVIKIPPGTHVITSPLKLANVDRVTLEGPATIVYRGPAAEAAVMFARCGYCTMRNIKVVVDSDHHVNATVLMTNLPGTHPNGRISTKNTFDTVDIGESPKAAKYGFSVDARALGGIDTNNEFPIFKNCSARGFKKSAYHLWGSQVHGAQIIGCSADGVDHNAESAVFFEYGVYGELRNCNFNRVKTCVVTGSFHVRLVIDCLNSEHCRQLLKSVSDGNSAPTTVTGCRWEGHPKNDDAEPTILVFSMGPVMVKGNVMTGINGVTPSVRVDCYQHQDPPGTLAGHQLGHAEITGNVFQVIRPKDGQMARKLIFAPSSWEHSILTGNTVIPWTDPPTKETFAGVKRLP